jgi:hypothetical protein
MKKKILKNRRRPVLNIIMPPIFMLFFYPHFIRKYKPFSIIKYFKFTESTMYLFDDEDQHDVNKLFGFSIGMHHTNSFRFGWRPNKDLTRMEIVGYEYHDKVRIPTIPICEVELNKWYKYEMNYLVTNNLIEYNVSDGYHISGHCSEIKLKKKLNWGYKLSLYFGGNKKAPHDMVIYQK